MARARGGRYRENRNAIGTGARMARAHPLIGPLPEFRIVDDGIALEQHPDEWLRVSARPATGYAGPTDIAVTAWPNVRRREAPELWAYAFARVSLHIALGHLDRPDADLAWHMACWYAAEGLLSVAGVGRRPAALAPLPDGLPRGDAEAVARHLRETPSASDLSTLTLGAPGRPFWEVAGPLEVPDSVVRKRQASLASGIRAAAAAAVDVAGGLRATLGAAQRGDTVVRRAREWVISELPLLAALTSSFTLIEDAALCDRMGVEVAAISDATQEIYFNPRVRFTSDEARFVMAHEVMHAGLRHAERRQGRDPWYWNVACDFVINDWLVEMRVGAPPEDVGYLHDPSLRGQSAEEVYDRIVRDLRWMRKLESARTLNGARPDILPGGRPAGWWRGGGADLDAFYRRALTEGLELHLGRGRGFLPAGLVEEIRALAQPPVPWDVKLAQWLDRYFPPLERRRSFARAHRRQAATPDIPRPAWIAPDEQRRSRVFAALIDTSGSMSRADLGKALGAIASYAQSRDVGFVRMIQCDAHARDAGYVEPEALLDRVQVTGWGGTVLMPGIRLLDALDDYPRDGPLLVITDGECDDLTIARDHAYLMADGGRLPFPTRAPVFRMAP